MPAKSQKVSNATKSIPHAQPKPPSLNWPSFEPKISPEDLFLHELYSAQIVTISNFWTSSLCKKYIKFLRNLPLVTTPGKPRRGEAVRVNDRFQIEDAQFAERLWSETGLKDLICAEEEKDVGDGVAASPPRSVQDRWGGTPVGLNPNIRIYRYSKGQFFDQHYDDSNNLIHPGPPPQAACTTWTLLLYLTSPTDGCLGGETVFYPDPPAAGEKSKKGQASPDPIVVGIETGMALLHKHGKECMLHEGREVLEGEKWVIRSDLCVRR
ncbi:MAG: hypothetical protein Q9162_007117 [Coniocarpon cinnabarinum]